MYDFNTFIIYILLLILISFLIYFYYHNDINIHFFKIFLFFILIFFFIYFYFSNFTKYGILRRIDYFTNHLEKIVPVIQKKRKYLSQEPSLHDYKLQDFYIFSSHNTYVAGNQNMDVNSLKMLKYALLLGIREIELDVYAKNYLIPTKDFLEPVVTHGVKNINGNRDIFLNSNILTFYNCIKTISKYAFINDNDDPLIINIELNTHNNNYTNNRIIKILKDTFKEKLLISNNINNLTNFKIKDLINKVIIIIHNLEINNKLKKISFDYYKNISSNYVKDIDIELSKEKIIRIYPPANIKSHYSYNYDPNEAWNKGIQLATFNIQVLDDNFKKQIKKFKKYSFVLKPLLFRKIK